MNKEIAQLKQTADTTKALYMAGDATYEDMRTACSAYVNKANERIKELAKEHGMRPKLISLHGYMR